MRAHPAIVLRVLIVAAAIAAIAGIVPRADPDSDPAPSAPKADAPDPAPARDRDADPDPVPDQQPEPDAPGLEAVETDAPTGVIVLRSLSLHYGPVEFDHGLHVSMCGFGHGCADCHHDTARAGHEPGEVLACRVCHPPNADDDGAAVLGLRGAYHRQCLGCHKDWAHENACGYCHMPVHGFGTTGAIEAGAHGRVEHRRAEDTYVYATRHEPLPVATFHHADHAQRFGLSCVDCHHGASCGDCHGSGSVSYRMDHRMGTCFGCHAWSNCVACHDMEAKPRFDHARTAGWPLGSDHAAIGCTSCHSPEHRFDAPTASRCRACHRVGSEAGFDHAALGVPLLSGHDAFDCVQCHRGRLHIGLSADCAACHENKRFPEDLPGRVRTDGPTPGSPGEG
jgi:hypothetical protein